MHICCHGWAQQAGCYYRHVAPRTCCKALPGRNAHLRRLPPSPDRAPGEDGTRGAGLGERVASRSNRLASRMTGICTGKHVADRVLQTRDFLVMRFGTCRRQYTPDSWDPLPLFCIPQMDSCVAKASDAQAITVAMQHLGGRGGSSVAVRSPARRAPAPPCRAACFGRRARWPGSCSSQPQTAVIRGQHRSVHVRWKEHSAARGTHRPLSALWTRW